jgi:hypothetical protein
VSLIVEHGNVVRLQSRQEMVLPAFERHGVHGLGRDDDSQTQAEDEGDRFL